MIFFIFLLLNQGQAATLGFLPNMKSPALQCKDEGALLKLKTMVAFDCPHFKAFGRISEDTFAELTPKEAVSTHRFLKEKVFSNFSKEDQEKFGTEGMAVLEAFQKSKLREGYPEDDDVLFTFQDGTTEKVEAQYFVGPKRPPLASPLVWDQSSNSNTFHFNPSSETRSAEGLIHDILMTLARAMAAKQPGATDQATFDTNVAKNFKIFYNRVNAELCAHLENQ